MSIRCGALLNVVAPGDLQFNDIGCGWLRDKNVSVSEESTSCLLNGAA